MLITLLKLYKIGIVWTKVYRSRKNNEQYPRNEDKTSDANGYQVRLSIPVKQEN